MYKLLLCWRYLRTRYIALACIVSVTLGVATLIVVNSVMEGFTREMQGRIHGILSDVILESVSVDGIHDADWHMNEIRKIVGDQIVGMSPTVHVPAMLRYDYGGQTITRPINLIGIDEATYSSVGDFGKYLQHPRNREQLSFALRDAGYDLLDHQADHPAELQPRKQLKHAGWPHRRMQAQLRGPATLPAAAPAYSDGGFANPFDARDADEPQGSVFDPAKEQHSGVVLGIALAAFRTSEGEERFLTLPGDDVRISYPRSAVGTNLKMDVDTSIFTVVDLYESKMSEYDASFVFVPLRKLQDIRGMIHPLTGIANFTSIQIKLKPGADLDAVRDRLRESFTPQLYGVYTWRDKQGPLLAATQLEITLLNILLFLIIAVAGFGILAIFFMIVVEKTRDIGILKSLGATGRGVMTIFLGYGLSLGTVGTGVGILLGLVFVWNINEIADLIQKITGTEVYDPMIYFFDKIPTIVSPWMVCWVAAGAIAIAVLASVLPAIRAARLHPVEALRYE